MNLPKDLVHHYKHDWMWEYWQEPKQSLYAQHRNVYNAADQDPIVYKEIYESSQCKNIKTTEGIEVQLLIT